MNSTILRFIAGLMIIGAIVTGFLGYRLTHKNTTERIKVVTPSYSIVLARKNLPVGHRISRDDIDTIKTSSKDNDAFSDSEGLIGKVLISHISKDSIFKHSHFSDESSIGAMIASHERAVAIKVNEIVGVGGFVKPGDHVDVLLYLRNDRETEEVTSAQVILTDVRVLAYGTLVGGKEHASNTEDSPSMPNKLGMSRSINNINSEKDSRSAILVVPEKDVSKLMLADSTGVLRLALRGPSSEVITTANDASHFIRLKDISQASDASSSVNVRTANANLRVIKKSGHIKRDSMIVHRGDSAEVVEVGSAFNKRRSD